jgi:hypothetical protein
MPEKNSIVSFEWLQEAEILFSTPGVVSIRPGKAPALLDHQL